MMRSLYSGISGLTVHQTKMDVIGNNIANVNTTAFKSSRVTFTDVFSQKLSGASAGNEEVGGTNSKQIGLGSTVGSIDILMGEGAAQRTDNELDLKIEGDGFFIVNDGNGYKFTRDGSFKIDVNGYLVTSNGYYVCGWTADKDGNIAKTPVEKLAMVANETYSVPASKTTKINFAKNLNIDDGSTEATGVTQLSTIFDSLGNEYTVKQNFYYIDSQAAVDKYNDNHDVKLTVDGYPTGLPTGVKTYDITMANVNKGAGATGDVTYPFWVSLGISDVTNAEGERVYASDAYVTQSGLTKADVADETGEVPLATLLSKLSDAGNTADGFPAVFKFDASGNLDKNVGAGITGIKLNFGKGTEPPIRGIVSSVGTGDVADASLNVITLSLNDLTQYNSSTTASSTYDGNKPGTMSSYSIGSDGIISAKYSNGQTKILGQISLATFSNSAGLEKVGGNLYQSTLNSGDFDGIGVDPTSVGSLNAGTLEMSNVDLSTEFTEMITTQRGFQANSRIITTSDTLLEELVNLKR